LMNKNREVGKKKLKRHQVLSYFAKREPTLVAMEACGSAHYWGRELEKQGHRVKLLPPRDVKPYVQGNKNDYNDALAIAEAVHRPKIRYVAIKGIEEQDVQALHRLKHGATQMRTKLVNQLRGLLSEYGIVVRSGVAAIRQAIPEILADGENGLSEWFRRLLQTGYERLCELDVHIKRYDKELKEHVKRCAQAQMLMTIPGYGPVVSSVYFSRVGNGQGYRRGRDVSASLGMVPRQHSTGDKQVLLGISKRGDRYLRSLLIHGARSVVKVSARKEDRLSCWVNDLVARRGKNKATVALANKMARIGWAVLTSGQPYQAQKI